MAKMSKVYEAIPNAVVANDDQPYHLHSYIRRRTVRIEFSVPEQFNEDHWPELFAHGLKIEGDSIQRVKFLQDVVTVAERKRERR